MGNLGGLGRDVQCEHGCSGVGDPPAPSVTTGLLGSVCWLGPELAGGGCHHRTASQSAAARGGLYTRPGALRAGGLSVVLSSPCLGLGCCWGAQARGGLLGLQDGTDARQLGARPWSGGWLPGGRPRPRCVLVWAEPCRGCGGGVASCWWVCLGAEPAVPPWPSAHSLALTAFLLCRCCQV